MFSKSKPLEEWQYYLVHGVIEFVIAWLIVTTLILWFGFGFVVNTIIVVLSVFTIHTFYTELQFYQEMKNLPQEIEKRRKDEEARYLEWCEPQSEEDRVLQRLADGLLEIYNWDGMPRIKARLGSEWEFQHNVSARYCGGFDYQRQHSLRVIEYKPSFYYNADIGALKYVMKHELVHAWIDWRGIGMSDPHGYEFQQKLNEVLGPGKTRKFTPEEITEGRWIKHSDQGLSFIVNFHPGGGLTERSTNNEDSSWGGSWELVDGVLRVRVGNYELDVTASASGNEHSGVELVEGRHNANFIVIHER